MDKAPRVLGFNRLPTLLGKGDVLVVNDAATFPGSIHFRRRGLTLEVRLFEKTQRGFKAVLFGPGDFHTRTEHRAPPPRVPVGEKLTIAGLTAEIISIDPRSHRLVELVFHADDARQWQALYRHGKPVQYAHQREQLPLWAVQNFYSERPLAAELPSAGHHLTFAMLAAAQQRGVTVARLTHATGLSSTGDDALDASLPWPERYSIPAETIDAVRNAKRVIAVGTSVLRALEAHAVSGELEGIATEPIGPETKLSVVDALLTGIHSRSRTTGCSARSLIRRRSRARWRSRRRRTCVPTSSAMRRCSSRAFNPLADPVLKVREVRPSPPAAAGRGRH